MQDIPFLKPSVVKLESYSDIFQEIDARQFYTNFGPVNERFESEIINRIYQGNGCCTTVNNCTSGLILAINAMRRPAGKYAVMPSFTFSATAQAALWCGLEPYFVDINDKDWSLDADRLAETIDKLGHDVAVVVTYATFGNNIDLSIYEQLQNQGVPVVIDAAPGFGAAVDGKTLAKGFGGAVVYSFHATKCFGIGEGGLVYSADEQIVSRVRQASNFGFSEPGNAEYLGLNAKLSEYAAAIGLASLDVMDAKINNLHMLYQTYLDRLHQSGLLEKDWQPQKITGIVPFQFFSIMMPKAGRVSALADYLAGHGVASRCYFCPCCHQQPCFKDYQSDGLKITEAVACRIIALPLWEGLESEQIDFIVNKLVEFDNQSALA